MKKNWSFNLLLLLTGLTLFLNWFDCILTPSFNAFFCGIEQDCTFLPDQFALISYASVSVVLLIWAWWSYKINRMGNLAWTGFFLSLLALNFYLQISFSRPSWLEAFLDGRDDYGVIVNISNQSSLPNSAESFDKSQLFPGQVKGISDRLAATNACLRLGWYIFSFCSVAIWVWGLTGIAKLKSTFRTLTVMGLTMLLLILCHVAGPVYSELEADAGLKAQSKGKLEAASRHFQNAIFWDDWHRINPQVARNAGEIYFQQEFWSRPETLFYLSFQAEVSQNRDAALDYLNQILISKNTEWHHLAKREIARINFSYGLFLFQTMNSNLSSDYLKRSIKALPSQMRTYYTLAFAQYNSGQYQAGIDQLNNLTTKISETTSTANAMVLRADCYFRLGQLASARNDYLSALDTDYLQNYLATKKLADDRREDQ